MPAVTHPTLDPDTIGDLLFLARTGETSELTDTLSHLANSHTTTPSTLLPSCIDPDSGNSTLHMASANGHTETIHTLLKLSTPTPNTTNISSASPPASSPLLNLPNSSLNTSLHWAALNGHLDAVKILVAAGADMQLVNKAGRDARGEAEMGGKLEVVEWLGVRCEGGGEEEQLDGGEGGGVQVSEGEEGGEGKEGEGREGG